MIIYLCVKFQSNTPILSKDITRKPFVLRTRRTDGADETDETDVRTDTCTPPPPENGGGGHKKPVTGIEPTTV